VKRVLSRLFNISAFIDAGQTQRRLWTLAESLAPWKSAGDFNQAMMELGARICGPRQPRCLECPVRRHCRGYAKGTQNRRPVRRPRKRPPHRETVAAVIYHRGRYLLCKRPSGGFLGGLWEFPAGPAKRGEPCAQSLVREIKAELGVDIEIDEHVATVTHGYSHVRVTMYVYRCRFVAGVPRLRTYAASKWVFRKALSEYPMPKANHKFLHLL
jgi:A/G-specific adenine glycosylase